MKCHPWLSNYHSFNNKLFLIFGVTDYYFNILLLSSRRQFLHVNEFQIVTEMKEKKIPILQLSFRVIIRSREEKKIRNYVFVYKLQKKITHRE